MTEAYTIKDVSSYVKVHYKIIFVYICVAINEKRAWITKYKYNY